MTINETIEKLKAMMAQSGDVPVVLCDSDTSWYFTLTKENFEFQRMENNSIRVSVGVIDPYDNKEPDCIEGPISLKKRGEG